MSKYSFGGIVFAIEADFPLALNEKLENFLVGDEVPADFTLKAFIDGKSGMAGEPTRRENTVYLPVNPENAGKINGVHLLSLAKAPCLMIEKDAFILHAAYALTGGRALLITAPSGTGKSTLASHWVNTVGGEIINGDRVLVSRKNGVRYANGVYVCGTSGICRNVSAPIGLVTLLKQGERNELLPLRPHELFMHIVCQCSYDGSDPVSCACITALVADLINEADVSCYSCINDPDAARELEKLKWIRK